MDTKMERVKAIRVKMGELGITHKEIARVSGIASPDVSAIFLGRSYAGPKRLGRLQAALHAIALERAAKAEEVCEWLEETPLPPPEPQIRRLGP